MSKYDDLVKKLKEIFQIDRPELDFGVYRILNSRVGEINDYLDKRLKAKVRESLTTSGAATIESLQKDLKEKEAFYREDGANPDAIPKVIEIKEKIAALSGGASEYENAVFTHLLTFFSRYYEKGDFISQRRYKGDTYAIPYAGEEVMLYWANKDQYYTKSGENFSNYAFKLDDGRTVRFRLISADTAKDNRKDNDKDRRFVLIEPHVHTFTDEEGDEYEEELLPVEEVKGELVLRFEYKIMPKGTKQEELVAKAAKTVLDDPIVKTRWLELTNREPTEKNPQRTLLEKCLVNYTAKNTADYFIHKDLGGFLRRELDFYIKNEVMHLDDVQKAEKFADIEKTLRLIQTLRAIAQDLITFLAQMEDFQKQLWLKTKFVVSTDYCVTLDRIPEALYPAIAASSAQWGQWESLGMLDGDKASLVKHPKTSGVKYLKEHPYLMADTALFGVSFKSDLLATMGNLDEKLDGLMIHGDNFQALDLLKARYREQIKCVYADPPYNTSASEIIYKNSFKHSTWLSLMENRISISRALMDAEDGFLCCTIDDVEQKVLSHLLENIFGDIAGTVSIRIKPSGRPIPNGFALSNEYAIFVRTNPNNAIQRLDHSEEQAARYNEVDEKGTFFWELFRKAGSNSNRSNRPTMFYPFYLNTVSGLLRLPTGTYDSSSEQFHLNELPKQDEIEINPIKDDGSEGCWYFGYKRAKLQEKEFKAERNSDGDYGLYYRRRPNTGVQPTTNWFDSKYSATEHGTALLKALFGVQEVFSYPKSIYAVEDCLKVMGAGSDEKALVLDYFAGSGTTAHAVIALNREETEERGHRKYILVEQAEYFDTVMKPRIQKVIYSADWIDGKPTKPETGVSHSFKVLRLESYEDTLNNLELQRSESQQQLLEALPKAAQEDYLLRYMMDIESRGSRLSVEQFKKPFDYKLKVTVDSAGAYEERGIDLVETFNYLIGLRVDQIDMQHASGYVSVSGWLPTGEKTLVLWRDVELIDYDKLNSLCDKLGITAADSKYEVVFINGDHNIPAVFTGTEAEGAITKTLKIRQIEPEFLNRMFTGAGA